MDPSNLTSKRLRYRAFQLTDREDLIAILTDPLVCRYLPGVEQYTIQQVEQYLKFFIRTHNPDDNQFIFAVRTQDDSRLIGYCGCAFVKEFQCNEIKYFLRSDQFGNGYATEMAETMKQLACEVGLRYLVGLADVRNVASQKVLEKIGYTYRDTIPLWGETMKLYDMRL